MGPGPGSFVCQQMPHLLDWMGGGYAKHLETLRMSWDGCLRLMYGRGVPAYFSQFSSGSHCPSEWLGYAKSVGSNGYVLGVRTWSSNEPFWHLLTHSQLSTEENGQDRGTSSCRAELCFFLSGMRKNWTPAFDGCGINLVFAPLPFETC